VPPAGYWYHGVFPGDRTGREDGITPADVDAYEKLAGARVAWVYFSHNWYAGRKFPLATARWIRKRGAVPFIRLMLRSTAADNVRETTFTVQAIARGNFDADFRAWARAAKQFAGPLIVEYGTECNGKWFGWNGAWTENHAAGVAAFAAAYRHIVQLMRNEGAKNITWVFHVNGGDDPPEAWNRFENYYPGNDVVDWVGVSVYGAQSPLDRQPLRRLRDRLDTVYPRLQAMAPHKPVFLLEFGCAGGNDLVQPDAWTRDALTDLLAARWPHLAGFSWWNSHFTNDNIPAHDTTMRLQDLPKLAQTFQQLLANRQISQRPVFTTK